MNDLYEYARGSTRWAFAVMPDNLSSIPEKSMVRREPPMCLVCGHVHTHTNKVNEVGDYGNIQKL